MAPNRRIFFFHNPKAAGESVKRALEAHFLQSTKAPRIENDVVDHAALDGNYKDFRGFDFYFGHYGRDVFEAVNDGHVCVTNFRHPINRMISLYNYFHFTVQLSPEQLAEERFFAVACAKKSSLHDFLACDDPRVRVYTNNQHTRQLTGSLWVCEVAPNLAEACQFVDRMSCYYICEYAELSALWMQETFGISTIPRINVTEAEKQSSVAELSAATRSVILKKNELDMQLYQYAVSQFLRWPKDVAGGKENYAPPSAGIGKGSSGAQRTRSWYLLPRLRW
jgi:hypothetical protein